MELLKKNKGLILIVIGFIGLIIFNFDKIYSFEGGDPDEIVTNYTTTYFEGIIVEIKGQVKYPGIYELNQNSRISDLIQAAGGLTEDADVSEINQASKISDEMIIEIPKKMTNMDTEIVRILVEIKGEITNPGIYSLYYNERLVNLIEKAGGVTIFADTTNLNMAGFLNDGDTIIIPKKEAELDIKQIYVEIAGEVISPGIYLIPETYTLTDLIYDAGGVTVNCDLTKINWNIKLVLGASIYIPSYSDTQIMTDNSDLININSANLETLITLPGIGDIIGQRIIDYRAEFGNFLSIEDIMYVSGIKESIYEQIKDYITV